MAGDRERRHTTTRRSQARWWGALKFTVTGHRKQIESRERWYADVSDAWERGGGAVIRVGRTVEGVGVALQRRLGWSGSGPAAYYYLFNPL